MSWIKIQSEYEDLDKYEFDDGDIIYCKKNKNLIHNPYGAAVIYKSGSKSYYLEGKIHRLDGPACIWNTGEEFYYINHKELKKEEFEMHPERLKFIDKEHLICLL
mgnify:FL=1